jgi:hypothetical protein
MSTRTIYTCDRCKQEVPKGDNLKGFAIGEINHSHYSGSSSYVLPREKYHKIDLCTNCAVELGLSNPANAGTVKPIDPPPGIEDLIRLIIQEEIAANGQT